MRSGWVLVVAVALVAVNLRTAVTSVGPVMQELSAGVGLSGGEAGLLTTLPVLTFAVLGALTPRLSRRFGERLLMSAALAVMAAGLLGRALVSGAVPFLLLSVVSLAGGAAGNVLLPVLVKRYFADRLGPMTALYTTALAVGTTASSALTVPLAQIRGGAVDWRLGLGLWCLPAAAATVWVALARTGRGGPDVMAGKRPAVHRSRTAWALTLFFAAQSMQAYIAFGWFALFFREHGFTAAAAGLLVAIYAGVAIPISLLVPTVAARCADQRLVLLPLLACTTVAYVGMLTAPSAGLSWMLLAGIGGGAFPLSLTMMGLRTRTPEATASLSAFAQSVGYLIAGAGPLLVGVLHESTGAWAWPFALLFATTAAMAVCGWHAAQPRYVEHDLASQLARTR